MNKSFALFVLSALAAVSGWAVPLSAQHPTTVRSYDLRSFNLSTDEGFSESLSAFPRNMDEYGESLLGAGSYGETGCDYVLDALDAILGESLREEDVELLLENRWNLVVRGTEPVQQQVQAALVALHAAIDQAFEMRVELVRWEGVPAAGGLPAAVLDPAQADAFVAEARKNGATVRTWNLFARPGRTSFVQDGQPVSYLSDFDVEIASGSVIADPVVRTIDAGDLVALRVEPADGGQALSLIHRSINVLGELELIEVHIQGRTATVERSPGGSGTDSFGMASIVPGPRFVEAPRVLTRSIACESFLPDGKVLSASTSVEIGEVRGSQVLLVRRTGGQYSAWTEIAGPRGRKLVAIGVGRYMPPKLEIGLDDFDPWDSPRQVQGVRLESFPADGGWVANQVDSIVQRTTWAGPWMIGYLDPKWDGRSAEKLEALRSMPALHAVRGLLVEQSGVIGARVKLPIAIGGEYGIAIGLTQARVRDYDVEVAQAAAIGDPVIAHDFQGLHAHGLLSASFGGPLQVSLEGFAQSEIGAPRSVDLAGGVMGPLNLVNTARVDVRERKGVAPSGTVVIAGAEGAPILLRISLP